MNRQSKLQWVIYTLIFGSWIYLGYESWTSYSVESQSSSLKKPPTLRRDSEAPIKLQAEESRHIITKIKEKGILPSDDWNEHRVDMLLQNHKGKSVADLIQIVGEPWYQTKWKDKVELHYKMDDWLRPGSPIDKDVSGFNLVFNLDGLVRINKSWSN